MKKTIHLLTRLLCWSKKGRVFKPRGPVIKVNVGCGLHVAPGWVNIDGSLNALCSKLPAFLLKSVYKLTGAREFYTEDVYIKTLKGNCFLHHDVRYGLPFKDESVDFVYSSHFLEHLYRDEAERFLKEAHRTLKKGGVLRICVPDLEYAVRLYHDGKKQHTLEAYFFTLSKDHQFLRHKYMYDEELLVQSFKASGFQTIAKRSFRVGETPDIQELDNREEETLFMEARK